MAYTDAQIEELKAVKDLDYAKATEFGLKHGISPRSVVAKAKALNLAYKVQTKGATKAAAKNKAPVRRKGEIAQSISELMDINVASLDKMTMGDLEVLEVRAKELVGA